MKEVCFQIHSKLQKRTLSQDCTSKRSRWENVLHSDRFIACVCLCVEREREREGEGEGGTGNTQKGLSLLTIYKL